MAINGPLPNALLPATDLSITRARVTLAHTWRVQGRGVVAYRVGMSARLDKSWMVLASHQTPGADRCVDLFSRPDGTFGFEEFRRDPEDMGAWTPVAYFSDREYATADAAMAAAQMSVRWLGTVLK